MPVLSGYEICFTSQFNFDASLKGYSSVSLIHGLTHRDTE